MKPTSYIFLILAAVLLFTGWTTCIIAETVAKSQGVQIFEQEKTKDGNTVYRYDLSDDRFSRLVLSFTDVTVKVVSSGTQSSYIELYNFDPYDYTTTLSGSTVTIDGNPAGLSSLIDMSGGGFQFKDLRYFFSAKPEKGRPRAVIVYLSDESSISSLNLTLKQGDLFVNEIYNQNFDLSLTVSGGNVDLNKVQTNSVITLIQSSGKEKSELNVNDSSFVTLNANLTGVIATINRANLQAEFISYNVKTTNSELYHNDSTIEDGFLRITSPEGIEKSLIKVDATNCIVYIKDAAV